MRAKRSKKYRKLMHQYELTFGFHEPYQVLGRLKYCNGRSIIEFMLTLTVCNSRLEFLARCTPVQNGAYTRLGADAARQSQAT